MQDQSLSIEPTEQHYGPDGRVCHADDPDCRAKSVHDHGLDTERFYVKRCTLGPAAGSLMAPDEPMSPDPRRMTAGREAYEFRKCSKECFESYLCYLQTKNSLHLRQAERL